MEEIHTAKSPALTAEQVQEVSDLTRQRYSTRYRELGRNIRTLGWGSESQQACRFRQTLACGVDFQDRSVIDIGCGFGDYLQFLKEQKQGIHSYVGYDLNENFIEEASRRFADETARFPDPTARFPDPTARFPDPTDRFPNPTDRFPNPTARFEVANVLEDQTTERPLANIGVMLGLLNFHWKDTADNLTYTRKALQNALRLVDQVLIVDFLSTRISDSWPREDFVFYHDPVEVLRLALELTPHVTIKHDYEPIPQQEFMLVLRK